MRKGLGQLVDLIGHITSLANQSFVALDLETTGLDTQRDEIIEVGAVKFQGDQILGSYNTLVNPHRSLSQFINQLTGITDRDLSGAPTFAAITGELEEFIGDAPLVGHNVAFELAFLGDRGIRLPPFSYDTWDLAFMLLPEKRGYSLEALASSLGITHPRPHRAFPDADVTRLLFLRLLNLVRDLDVGVISGIKSLLARGQWPLEGLFAALESEVSSTDPVYATSISIDGFDRRALGQRLISERPTRKRRATEGVDENTLNDLIENTALLRKIFPGYERREEQVRMMKQVHGALNSNKNLIIEGGTGIGKSLAYLLPAAMFAVKNQARVVISTNTINLQEQLILKDIPLVAQLIGEQIEGEALDYAYLKGRGNYLCMRRWSHQQGSELLTQSDSRFLSKILMWLQTTGTGDRSEMTFPPQEERLWDHLSARGAQGCELSEGICFLRSARERARGAHILVVNHALLLADAASGSSVIPEHDYLIVDEAHHIEEEATRQFGFRVFQDVQMESLNGLANQRGLIQQIRTFLARRGISSIRMKRVDEDLRVVEKAVAAGVSQLGRLFGDGGLLVGQLGQDADGANRQLGITSGTRAQPDWSNLEILWEETDLGLRKITELLERMSDVIAEFAEKNDALSETLQMELTTRSQDLEEARSYLREALVEPKQGMIYWLTQSTRDSSLVVHGTPLEVGTLLQRRLYGDKQSVILTGATLTSGGAFDHFRRQVGLTDAEEHLEGSPFDYENRALLLVPKDIPEPYDSGYPNALANAIVDLAKAAEGRTMVLFTAYASLRAVQRAIRGPLNSEGIKVLAQGVDGSAPRILASFLEDSKSVLLGTNSFWEGIDVAPGSLKVLVLARLPFPVPTDPVFAARSQLYDNPFTEYTIPKATLRFRQGFGRLIRRHEDKGAVVVLDKRLISKAYGTTFMKSIPSCTFKTPTLAGLPFEVKDWLER